MNQIVWKDRLCIILKDGQWAMSRVGAWADFNFVPDKPDGKEAVAGSFDAGRTMEIRQLDENRLLFVTTTGDFVMIGDPCKGGRIEQVEKDRL